MNYTKKRFQELAGVLTEGEVINFADYKREKERERYHHEVIMSADGQIMSTPEEWIYVILTHRDQADALVRGDVKMAEKLGAKFYDVKPGMEELEIKL